MTDSTLTAIKAIITRLNAYTDLTDIVSTRIYTDIPQQTAYPFILLEIESSDFSTFDDPGMQHTLRLHGYGRTNTITETARITQEIYKALNRQENNISLDVGSVVLLQFAGVKTNFKEPDGITWHSVIEFNFIID